MRGNPSPAWGEASPLSIIGDLIMNRRNTSSSKKSKWISSSIAAMAYLAGIREVDKGDNSFLACDLNIVEGPANGGAEYRRFSCIVVGEKAQELISSLQEDLEQEQKILMGVILRGFKPSIFEYKKGQREGELDVSFQSALMYIDWIRINQEEVYRVDPEEKEEQQRLSIPRPADEDDDQEQEEKPRRSLGHSSKKPTSSSRKTASSSKGTGLLARKKTTARSATLRH